MTNNFAAHLDMLGFSNAIIKNFTKAWDALKNLKSAMDQSLNIEIIPQSTGIPISKRISEKFFSDSIILFTPNDTNEDLLAILISASQLFANALKLCIPLRGGIAHGRFCVDSENELFMGESLVRAHSIGENAQWSGITVDKTIAERVKNTILKNYVVDWQLPLKNGSEISQKVLNWPKAFANGFTKKPPISVADYYEAFEPMFGPYQNLAPEVKLKYENTVKFINKHLPLL